MARDRKERKQQLPRRTSGSTPGTAEGDREPGAKPPPSAGPTPGKAEG